MTLSSYFIGISGTIAVYYLIVLEEKPLFIGLLVYILASLGCVR
jgi:DHA1 family bicyclomycin/chloramphenicol resistance-like MFS transporter